MWYLLLLLVTSVHDDHERRRYAGEPTHTEGPKCKTFSGKWTGSRTPYYNSCTEFHGFEAPNWMKNVPDSTKLTQMTIPMSHESLSFYGDSSGLLADMPACQSMELRTQLDSGIRALDIRLVMVKGELKVYHVFFSQHRTLQYVIDTVNHFLYDNPSEGILINIQEEDRSGVPGVEGSGAHTPHPDRNWPFEREVEQALKDGFDEREPCIKRKCADELKHLKACRAYNEGNPCSMDDEEADYEDCKKKHCPIRSYQAASSVQAKDYTMGKWRGKVILVKKWGGFDSEYKNAPNPTVLECDKDTSACEGDPKCRCQKVGINADGKNKPGKLFAIPNNVQCNKAMKYCKDKDTVNNWNPEGTIPMLLEFWRTMKVGKQFRQYYRQKCKEFMLASKRDDAHLYWTHWNQGGGGQIHPYRGADKSNRMIVQIIWENINTPGGFGIVGVDFPGHDVIKSLILANPMTTTKAALWGPDVVGWDEGWGAPERFCHKGWLEQVGGKPQKGLSTKRPCSDGYLAKDKWWSRRCIAEEVCRDKDKAGMPNAMPKFTDDADLNRWLKLFPRDVKSVTDRLDFLYEDSQEPSREDSSEGLSSVFDCGKPFFEIDTNGDGAITQAEYTAACSPKKKSWWG